LEKFDENRKKTKLKNNQKKVDSLTGKLSKQTQNILKDLKIGKSEEK